MLILNFAHPLTAAQLVAVKQVTGQSSARVIEVETYFDTAQPFAEQARALVESIGLSTAEWQKQPLLVNLPNFNIIAALVLAELHGRMGYFPAVLRLRPAPEITPPQFEVAEIINLQAVRDAARQRR